MLALQVAEEQKMLTRIEQLDPHADLRNKLREVAASRDDSWAGIPMPLEGEQLCVEPRYPGAGLWNSLGEEQASDAGPVPLERRFKQRNAFHCSRKKMDVYVLEKHDGRVTFHWQPMVHHLRQDMHTMGCSEAWGIEQEGKAIQLLGTLLRHHAFKHYLLSGMFLETSKRSGLTYLFRKLKPTVVITPNKGNHLRVLCALCMHPIGYYRDTWAGAMCPTDDVVAHLQMMRGDEAMFWKRSQQHPAWSPLAGL